MVRVALVLGSERSGTSSVVGVLRELGWRVPAPELAPNDMNPRGFGEPEWAVRFDAMLLEWANVHISDARPHAWDLVDGFEYTELRRDSLRNWLAGQVDLGSDVIVKDPRLTWLYPLWRQSVLDVGAEPLCAVVGRAPAETLASKLKVNPDRREAGGLAGWVNVSLRAERVTRGHRRAFVTYASLLADWRNAVRGMGKQWDLALDVDGDGVGERVGVFLDESLRHHRSALDDFDVPAALRTLADETWTLITRAADGDEAPAAELDSVRDRYTLLYELSESLVESSLGAVRRAADRRVRKLRGELARASGTPSESSPAN